MVLETALEALLGIGASEAGVRPAAAAVATAIVEVQGPEFCPTSKTHPVAQCGHFFPLYPHATCARDAFVRQMRAVGTKAALSAH